VLDTGDAKCWGRNAGAVLGLGHQENIGNQPGEMGDDLPTVDIFP
jgi:hypothetical protein